MLGQIMGAAVHEKVMEKYMQRADPTDPFFTLVLVNQGMGHKLLQLNPGLRDTWPAHLSYLLMNSQICDKIRVNTFIFELSKLVTKVRC